MQHLRITTRTLTDGSFVYQVRFEATHADSTFHRVTLEVLDQKAAARLLKALHNDVVYAETDPS